MIVTNSYALTNASKGVRRYADHVIREISETLQLQTLNTTNLPLVDRFLGLSCNPGPDKCLWTPTPVGSLISKNQIVTVHDCIGFSHVLRNDIGNVARKFIFQRIFKNCACIVFISESAQHQFENIFSLPNVEKRVIKSGFPHKNFFKVFKAKSHGSESTGQPYILSVGNSLEYKNIGALCEAFVNSKLPNAGFRLTLVGSLDLRAKKIISNFSSYFICIPQVSDEELKSLMSSAYVYVSPSLIEGHNLTIAEALLCETPVLASDIAVHREFYDGMCIFFDVENKESLVNALDNLLINRPLAPPYSIIKAARGFEDTARDYVELFNYFDNNK